ncbi:MAG TPA: DUF512 domain-containing protein, partial [Clostridia bacterium]|nr:DUF512 domain-containing protein [Clostridia bacterium]
INQSPVRDVIDYHYLMADEKVLVDIARADNEYWVLEIEKDFDDTLGVEFENPVGKVKSCANKCLFCFVDQMPPGMRGSLYIKDDDYRLSFLRGNFITLTNLTKKDLDRIVEQHLSPLYVSVHTTDENLRRKMMGSKNAGKVLEQLRYLTDNDIEMHTQIVLCPGLNDGGQLQKTIADLSSLWPGVRSIAVVPVGLTAFRANLHSIQGYTPEAARELVCFVGKMQNRFKLKYGYPLVFAADEFYLCGKLAIPEFKGYADFPQVENGVGISRIFLEEWALAAQAMPASIPAPRKVTLITGILAKPVVAKIVASLNNIANLSIGLVAAKNNHFGHSVTVAGLLSGRDILTAARGCDLGDVLILPRVLFKEEESLFLDGMSLADIESELDIPICVAENPHDLLKHAIGG